jgi:hypothetical protein
MTRPGSLNSSKRPGGFQPVMTSELVLFIDAGWQQLRGPLAASAAEPTSTD